MEQNSSKNLFTTYGSAVGVALLVLVLVFLIIGVRSWLGAGRQEESSGNDASGASLGSVLFVNSYHEGFEWSDGILTAMRDALQAEGVVDFSVTYMDTKNNPTDEFGVQAGIAVRDLINTTDPDVVIACDDAAFKYVVQPYFRDTERPFVFCGVNYSLDAYGGPYVNTTGIIEVAAYEDLIELMRPHADGDRIGFITGDNISEYRNADWLNQVVGDEGVDTVFVQTAEEWKREFLSLQDRVDMIVMGISAGIEGWDDREMRSFTAQETLIPTGVEQEWMTPFAVFGATKIPGEQGHVAAEYAIRILKGANTLTIPIVTNQKSAIFVNQTLADRLGYVLAGELLRSAVFVR